MANWENSVLTLVAIKINQLQIKYLKVLKENMPLTLVEKTHSKISKKTSWIRARMYK